MQKWCEWKEKVQPTMITEIIEALLNIESATQEKFDKPANAKQRIVTIFFASKINNNVIIIEKKYLK